MRAVDYDRYGPPSTSKMSSRRSLGTARAVLVQLPPRCRKDHVLFAKKLLEGGGYRQVVDRIYPLDDEAARHVETGQESGNVVLTLS